MGILCLREEAREGAGDGSLFPVTLDDTRLFLSGLQKEDGMKEHTKKDHTCCDVRQTPTSYLDVLLLAGDSLLLLLLFMACRVCLSVVCRVCLSVPCLVSLSVRPWMAL